jgi:hypothetical protein
MQEAVRNKYLTRKHSNDLIIDIVSETMTAGG